MKKTIVIGDVHGRWKTLKTLLMKNDALDEDGIKNPDIHVVQVGDLFHFGHGASESEGAEEALSWIDECLIGNHELPVFGGPAFSGWSQREEKAVKIFKANDKKKPWKACTSVGSFFVSHAGLPPSTLKKYASVSGNAADLASYINDLFAETVSGRRDMEMRELFYAIGWDRGGRDRHGGIFWLGWDHLRSGYREMHLPQIVGHTPQRNVVDHKGWGRLWNIDMGGGLDFQGIGALVIDINGEVIKVIEEMNNESNRRD